MNQTKYKRIILKLVAKFRKSRRSKPIHAKFRKYLCRNQAVADMGVEIGNHSGGNIFRGLQEAIRVLIMLLGLMGMLNSN